MEGSLRLEEGRFVGGVLCRLKLRLRMWYAGVGRGFGNETGS